MRMWPDQASSYACSNRHKYWEGGEMKNTMFFMAMGCTLSEETVLNGNETSLL